MEKILVLDFGGQYNQLIARRVRDNNVYAEILPYTAPLSEIKEGNYKGIIFTGGPNSVFDMSSPHYTKEILELGIPVLGRRQCCDRGTVRIRQNRPYGYKKTV